MQIQVLKENLVKTIQLAAKFASTRSQLPILSHVALEAGDDGIFITATSLDTGVRLRMAGKIIEKGLVAVPAKLLADLSQTLPLGGVAISGSFEEGLLVTASHTKTKLQTANGQDFPPFPEMPEVVGTLKLGELQPLLNKVLFAVSADEARPVLTGVLWKLKTGELVATDGYRLSLLQTGDMMQYIKAPAENLVLPGKLISQLLQSAIDYGVEELQFGLSLQSQQVLLEGKDFRGVTRLVSGDFPKYEAIIPNGSSLEFSCDREQLLNAVRAAAIFARDSANIVRFGISGSLLKVSANTAQVGEHEVEVEIQPIQEGENSIAFNAKYLVDFLSRSEQKEIRFGMTDSLRPGLFTEVGNEVYRHVIMPVRVRG